MKKLLVITFAAASFSVLAGTTELCGQATQIDTNLDGSTYIQLKMKDGISGYRPVLKDVAANVTSLALVSLNNRNLTLCLDRDDNSPGETIMGASIRNF